MREKHIDAVAVENDVISFELLFILLLIISCGWLEKLLDNREERIMGKNPIATGRATSVIDISDGLLADAGHLASASGVGIVIEPGLLPISAALASCDSRLQIERWALTGGDDYELCFTLPSVATTPDGCTRIGEVIDGEGVDCGFAVDSSGGYRHF